MRLTCCLLLALAAAPLAAQTAPDSAARPIAAAGVFRAAALVDSVYLDRQRDTATIDAGDFTAYLMARLGLRYIPPDFGFTVTADTLQLRIGGRIADLPAEARQALAQLVYLLPPDSRLEGQVVLLPAGREAVRFHLQGASVRGIPVPETFLALLMADIGRKYPALTDTGRDLFVQVPPGAGMRLVDGGVSLRGPPP